MTASIHAVRAVNDTTGKNSIPAASGALSDAELDAVCGGINPQPLPPMPRRDQ